MSFCGLDGRHRSYVAVMSVAYYAFKLDISSDGGYISYMPVVSIVILRCDDANICNHVDWSTMFLAYGLCISV